MFVRKNGAVELLVLAALLAAVLVCREAPAQTPQTKPTDRITGVVINSVTREPVARALIVSDGERFATLTDSSGHFEFVFADDPGGKTGSGPGSPAASSSIRPVFRPYMLTARK